MARANFPMASDNFGPPPPIILFFRQRRRITIERTKTISIGQRVPRQLLNIARCYACFASIRFSNDVADDRVKRKYGTECYLLFDNLPSVNQTYRLNFKKGTRQSNADSLWRDLIGILAANKILLKKSFFANKKGFYGLAESGRTHKRDGRYLAAKYTIFLP